MSAAARRWLRLSIGFAATAGFVWLLVRELDLGALGSAFAGLSAAAILLALLFLAAGYAVRIVRWWFLLRVLEPCLPLGVCIGPFLASIAVNNVLPLRAGDALRVLGFRRQLRSPAMRVLGTLVIERTLDLFVLSGIFLLGLLGLPDGAFPHGIVTAVRWTAGSGLATALASVWFLPLIYRRRGRLARRAFPYPLLGRGLRAGRRFLAGRRWGGAAIRHGAHLAEALGVVRAPRRLLALGGLSAVAWVCEGMVFVTIAAAVQAGTAPFGLWLSFAAGTLATVLPSSPGYVGTFDYFAAQGLAAYGAAPEVAAAFALTVHALLWTATTVAGVLCLLPSWGVSRFVRRRAAPKASRPHVAVIGAGFCGLAAAYELGRLGIRATVLERDAEIGGLAGSFAVGGERLEKFYHHWFTNDVHVMQLIAELGKSDRVLLRPTRTGMYHAHHFFRLSTPVDLLRFSPLPFRDRLRLGLLALRVRRVKDWRRLEERTTADWLREMGGERVYQVVWEPLLKGKFGDLAEEVAAVWFWNKLKLRGGSRGKGGEERLAYHRGGFTALADALAEAIHAQGGEVRTGAPVCGLQVDAGKVTGVVVPDAVLAVDGVIATPALPIVAGLVQPHVPGEYVERLRRIRYLANVCVVLELDRSLSDLYWLNVNDPGFPFVGVIEHTNFKPESTYAGRHIVYLSRYLPTSDALYRMPERAVVRFTLEHLRRLLPATRTPLANLFLATMAQIYPEDRGTNYAIRQGREVARTCAAIAGDCTLSTC